MFGINEKLNETFRNESSELDVEQLVPMDVMANDDNFFNYIMDNFETELVVLGAKIALKTYKLPIEPSQLKNFNQFHKKYGKYIVEPN